MTCERHDLAVLGYSTNGQCRACRREYDVSPMRLLAARVRRRAKANERDMATIATLTDGRK